MAYQFETEEEKRESERSFLRALGHAKGEIESAIGCREDLGLADFNDLELFLAELRALESRAKHQLAAQGRGE